MFTSRAIFGVLRRNQKAQFPQTLHSLPSARKISGCIPALWRYSFFKKLHLKFLTVFWIRFCLDNCSVNCYVLHQIHSEFWHIQHCFFSYMLIYSNILSVSEGYWHICGHYQGILRLTQAYSGSFVTLAYLQPCRILSPVIFRMGGLFKTLWNVDQVYSEPYHRALFIHIQNLV